MATITRIPVLRHCSTGPTAYVHHMTRGVVRHAGAGQAFWFRAIDATISEIPIDDRELPLLVTLRTEDLQQLTAPATVTFRVADPELAARRVDFSIDLASGVWLEEPLETIAAMLHGATASAVVALLAADPLERALRADPVELDRRVTEALRADARIAAVGLEIVGVRFGLLRPEPDVERAMQTPARERIQQDADKATFARRALAVEREAAIGENELANQIELARRQEDLIARRGANARREAEEAAAAGAIAADADAAKVRTVAEARADADRVLGEAKAAGERARLDAYRDVAPEVLASLALQQLAASLPSIERLTITPDLLTDVLGRLGGGGGAALATTSGR
ncbi:SPFH domain-containing protein [Agrococcus versicolor]|uniref:SPFH domain-containing protein n=1 Tax=Agrococcus versicolor TaxID=501482 RepID=A0ABN3AIN9_9MICO